MCGTIKRILTNRTTKDTKLKLYKELASPVLLCIREKWALNRATVETAGMKSVRKVAGHSLEDEISNLTI